MTRLQVLLNTTIGRKQLVAVTGILLVGFVLGHLSGNFLLYVGPNAFNAYGKSLEDLGPILWGIRAGLLAVFLSHITLAMSLARRNQNARKTAYRTRSYLRATFASRAMVLSGLLLLAFIAYHLAHFTFHCVHDTGMQLDELGRRDIYRMVILGFQQPAICVLYIFSMVVLSAHLVHGIDSLFQTFGIDRHRWGKTAKCAGRLFAVLVFVGYTSIPISVWTGCLTLSSGGSQ